MSKEIVKAIFDENIAGVREDLTFDAYFDSIKGNEEYKKGLFENYVNDGTKSYEEFNAETFGVGKPEAPSEVGGAESSPTGLGLNESEVGPPAGGTPPGAEPVGAPVSDAIEPIEPGEPEAPAITVGLEEFSVIDNKKDKGFLETIFGWLGGEKTFERVEKPFEELVPARQRLFKKAAAKDLSKEIGSVFTEAESDENITELGAKGFLSTNNLAGYLAGDFKEDNVAREEINKFLEEGVSGQTEAFKRFKGSIDPIIAEQSNEIKETMLKDRAYINLNKEIDREFASQRAEIDAKYKGVIDAKEQAKLDEATVGLLAEYDAVMLSLPTENDVLAKENEMITKYQLLVNDGKMDVDAAKAELQKEYDSYIEDINAKATEAKNAYNSGLEKAAEKIKSGLKDTEEYKQYISELTELRNGIITSREGDLKAIQARIQGDLAPKYNERINSVIRASSSGPTPLLEKSGLLPTIQKVINNKGFDLLPFDQKKAFLDRAFGNVVVQLREKGVAINDGTVAQARNEFDDAVMSKAYFTQKGTPSLYMLKTRAIEEAEKLDEVIASTKAKTGTKTFTSGVYASEFGQQGKGYDDRELDQLLLAREKLQEIIDLPENMTNNEFTNFWNGLTSGQFIDYLPFVSGLKNLAGSLALYRSLEDDTPASRYLQNAVALGNSYKGVYEANNMASDWYKSGTSTVESIPFMGEFVFTAGMSSVARKSTEKFLIKLFGGATEKTVAGKGMRVLAGTLVGALAQTTANPQRYIDETIKRMTPQMSMIFSEEGDDLIAMLDESTAEGGFEAFLKGYGVTASEYFSENLGFVGARALKYAGSKMMQNEFLKRLVVGYYMSKLNIDMPTAVKRLAGAAGYNGLPMELVEEIFNKPLTNLITGDADVMAGILTESGDLDIESLMEVGRALVPISAAGVGANVLGIAVKSMTPENVTISYRDINNLPATETIDRGVWEKVTEALKSPDKLREFISNELPRLKVEGKAREIITRELESGLGRFEGGVVESTKPPQAKGAAETQPAETQPAETQPAPKVSVQMKERKKLSADKKRLVGTGKFDFVVTIDGKEQNISRAEYNEYKRSGKLPEGIGADVLGEVDRVEGVVVESTKDAESIKTSLEGVEVPAELGTIENVAEVYEQAKGKEELTDEEVAVVDFVEGNVAKVEGVSEGVVEIAPEVETAVSPLQDVESTAKALGNVKKEIQEKKEYVESIPIEKGKHYRVTGMSEIKSIVKNQTLQVDKDKSFYDNQMLSAISEASGIALETLEDFNGVDNNKKLRELYNEYIVKPSKERGEIVLSPRTKSNHGVLGFVKQGFFYNMKPGSGRYGAPVVVGSENNSSFIKGAHGNYNKNIKNENIDSGKPSALSEGFEAKNFEFYLYEKDKGYYKVNFNELNALLTDSKSLSQAYHKAKADNSNPELVKAVEDLLGVTPEAVTPEVSGVAEVAETQPSAETPTQPLTLKEKAKEAKQKADEAAEKIKRLLGGRNGGLGISPFGRAKRLAEIDAQTLIEIKNYIYYKTLQGVYTFQDFVKDMKENFRVEIRVVDSDKAIFDSAASRFEIDDAFAKDILDLKDNFLFSIAAMSGRINMNFLEFISSNQAVVDQFVQNAQTNYGLNENQAMMLVKDMYQDALQAAANRSQLYTTIDQVKDFNKNKEELLAQELEMQKARINEEIKRRRNFLSRNYENFKNAFISPVKNFNRVFGYKGGGLMDYRTSQEREVYSARKFRMGASTKAANWYNEVYKMIYGDLNYSETERLNKYLIYRRIVDVAEMRNQRAIEHENLKKELAAGVTPVRKQQIKDEMAALEKSGIDEVKSGSIMVNGKREQYTTELARAFVNDIDGRTDAEATKIKERAEMYTKANNELLKMRLDAGLISQEAYDSMEKRDYVRRMFIDLSNTSIDEVSYPSVSKEIKAIKQGSEDKILEMDTQTLLQINSQITFDAVAKNNFMNKAVDWAQNKQQGYLAEAIRKAENVRKKRARYLGSTAQNLTPDEIDKLTKEQTLFIVLGNNDKAPSGFTSMKYFVNGIEKNIAVRNDMVNLFQTPSGRGVNENSLGVKVLSNLLLTPLIKSSAVFLNPAFAIGNFALDVIHASMVTMDLYKSFSKNIATILIRATGYTAENIYRKSVKYGASFFGQTARDSKFENLVKDYFEHGGGMSGLSNPTSRMYSDKLSKTALSQAFGDAKDGIVAVLDVINSLQSGSELITRVIIYEAALEKNIAAYKDKHGVDPTGYELTLMKISAAASAADLIDFREGTSATRVLDQTMLPFLNAMIQGAKAEVDFASKNPLLAATRLAEFGGMALAVALYNVKSGEDDEKEGIIGYSGVSEYIKSNYFVMMMPWTKVNERGEVVRPFLSIKLPAALKATNILVSGMVSDQGSSNTIGQVVGALEGGYVPEIGSIPPLGQITMALTANKDAFRKGAPIYRGRPDVLLTERFNAGETKAIYRDLFGAAYDLMNEDGENKGVLGFNEAGPAQWQAAFEKAISPNNPYYLGVTSIYAGFSSLYGKENQKEVDVLMDEKFSALNAFRSRVYREPQSGIQAKNIEDREKIDFLRDQIGSWKKKNDDAIEFAAKQLRDISKLDAGEKQNKIDRFFDVDVFDFISDAQIAKSVRAQGIKEIPENMDKIKDFIRDEESRLSLKLLEEFKPNFVFKHPSLKRYALSKDSYLELNEDLISGIGKEYDLSRDRKAYLIALKFVAGDDYKDIVAQIGAHQRDLSIVEGIQNDKSAIKYKRSYFRPYDRSSKMVSSESAINNLILLKYLLENE